MAPLRTQPQVKIDIRESQPRVGHSPVFFAVQRLPHDKRRLPRRADGRPILAALVKGSQPVLERCNGFRNVAIEFPRKTDRLAADPNRVFQLSGRPELIGFANEPLDRGNSLLPLLRVGDLAFCSPLNGRRIRPGTRTAQRKPRHDSASRQATRETRNS